MKLSVVIPNYNGAELLKKNLPEVIRIFEAYTRAQNEQAEIIIVDDGSIDDSREVLGEMLVGKIDRLHVHILFNQKNFGFSTTVNKGVVKATGEIVILLNTDVVPEKDFLMPLLAHFSDEKVFAVGCMDQSIEQGKVVLRGRGIGRWEQGLLVHSAGDLDKKTTLWVSGGSGAFRRAIWEKLGGLAEILNPFYGEDIDLGYRALKSGYKLVFEKESVVRHTHEEGSIKKTQSQRKILATTYRNQHLLTYMNATDYTILFSYVISFPKYLYHAITHREEGYLNGLMAALYLLIKALRQRQNNKKLFKLTDKEVIKEISL